MLKPADAYFENLDGPTRECMLYLRRHILAFDARMHEKLSYGMPFYLYGNKRLCYLWTQKSGGKPYVGFVDGNRMDHPLLLAEKRARMKIFPVDPDKDLPLSILDELLQQAIALLPE